jgi:hypothetical protein
MRRNMAKKKSITLHFLLSFSLRKFTSLWISIIAFYIWLNDDDIFFLKFRFVIVQQNFKFQTLLFMRFRFLL